MLNFHFTYQWLQYRRPTGPPSEVPKGLERYFVPTPSGPLEILSARPQSPTSKAPIFFLHGGMGGAWVWIEYLRFFAAQGIPCYAISLRGHGESWKPGYLRMVFGTGKEPLAEDAVAGIRWVEERENQQVVLVGHSAGGGLSQFILTEGKVQVKGLGLLAAVSGFGSYGVYLNWAKLDPWFLTRVFLHFWHPNSPVSHPALTKQAFFSDAIPDSYVLAFQRRICPYESLIWPNTTMRPFADAKNIWRNVAPLLNNSRVFIMGGTEDKLMTIPVMRSLAEKYRTGLVGVDHPRSIGTVNHPVNEIEERQGVMSCFAVGAAHHLQNDVEWRDGAEKLLGFYNQL